MPCGWCLTHDHLVHADGRAPCGCWCAVSAAPLMAGQNTAWRYRCDVCSYRRSGTEDEVERVGREHEEEHVDMYERAWAMLDDLVQNVKTLDAAASDANGPPEQVATAKELWRNAQNQGRGASAVLATMLQVEPSTIASEAGARADARARGKARRVLSAAELRGQYEGPSHSDNGRFES